MYIPVVFNSMQIKAEPRSLRLLIYSFMVLLLSFLRICSIQLQYQKVKLFASEGHSSYFHPRFSFQNIIPLFSNTVIPMWPLQAFFPLIQIIEEQLVGVYPSLWFSPGIYLLWILFGWFCLSSVFCNTSCLYEII